MKLEFSQQIFEKYSRVQENLPSGNTVVPCGQTDISKLTVVFCNFANMLKIGELLCNHQ
jgi:hypothetical protein